MVVLRIRIQELEMRGGELNMKASRSRIVLLQSHRNKLTDEGYRCLLRIHGEVCPKTRSLYRKDHPTRHVEGDDRKAVKLRHPLIKELQDLYFQLIIIIRVN